MLMTSCAFPSLNQTCICVNSCVHRNQVGRTFHSFGFPFPFDFLPYDSKGPLAGKPGKNRVGTSGGRNFRPPGRNFRPYEKLQKCKNESGHIFLIRTPFSMILGSLDSQQKALQDHVEKHHCPSCEEEVTRREFYLSKKDTSEKPPT